MPFFSRVFKHKEISAKRTGVPVTNGHIQKAQWSDAWLRTRVDPEEVVELLQECTLELKSRALDIPFMLLPFRPSTDNSAARTVVRNYFSPQPDRDVLRGTMLVNELKMTDAMVLASVIKWCWSRLPGGVVTWETYEMFKVGERDCQYARDSFSTFIPISVESDARVQIIRDFFDLLAAVAAHGKTNGLGGHKLSRYAGWWAFEHYDTGKGFETGYKSWASAASATSHLFFAYLRSMSPESSKGANGILGLPLSLQQLLDATNYPPTNSFMSNETTRVVMIVDVVSPTPYALLRRAKNFEYRDDDSALQQFASYEDPVDALTNECQRVLKAISSTNQSAVSTTKTPTTLLDPSWSRFEDLGFGSTIEEVEAEDGLDGFIQPTSNSSSGLNKSPRSTAGDFGRPTTPSWADFLNSGFIDENGNKAPAPVLLPPDKFLPPISTTIRGQSSQSHRRNLDTQSRLEPGELASINKAEIDDAFWWVWISSLAAEEPTSRKAVFGRCALIETVLPDGKWMVMEEQVKGAAPEPTVGAYIAEKKSFLGFSTKRGRLTRRRSAVKKSPLSPEPHQQLELGLASRSSLAPDQQAKIQQAAAELTRKNKEHPSITKGVQRGRMEEDSQSKTTSVFTLQPLIQDEASPAMQWASQYDKNVMRAKYLGDAFGGKGSSDMLTLPTNGLGIGNGSVSTLSSVQREHNLPVPPPKEDAVVRVPSLPALPALSALSAPEPISTPTIPALEPVLEPARLPVAPVETVEPEATEEAVEDPLPNGTALHLEPTLAVEQTAVRTASASRPDKTVVPASPESKKLRKKAASPPSPLRKKPGPPPVQKTTGIRRLFGTMRSRSRSREPTSQPTPTSPVETNPAILAARRALEGKDAPATADPASSPQPSPTRFKKLREVKRPIAAIQTATSPAPPVRSITPPAEEELLTPPEPAQAPPPIPEDQHISPPKTRRDEEYDQLSRVDTNEREHADKEFSTFDQGPLLDQPAFAPQDSPSRSGFFTPAEEPAALPKHTSVYSAVTLATSTYDELGEPSPELTQQISPGDRWAQIRKNAAERAAKLSEETGRKSHTETRTDDGETSGEETIESRVARIKARVAELTGNMENARR